MSYQTYTTDAIVCGSYDRLTADRTYLLFTESAGMVYATARSSREERSKQRFALQDFAHVRVSLVKGKSGWRIGSVEALGNYYTAAPSRTARGQIVATIALLRRLLTGEDAQPAVYHDTTAVLQAFVEDPRDTAWYDTFALRTLAHLGYVAPHTAYKSFLQSGTSWLEATTTLPPAAQTAVTEGLAASHL